MTRAHKRRPKLTQYTNKNAKILSFFCDKLQEHANKILHEFFFPFVWLKMTKKSAYEYIKTTSKF